MKYIFYLAWLLFIINNYVAFSQKENNSENPTFSLNGIVVLAIDKNSNGYLSFNGPSLNIKTEDINLGFSFMPSLKISDDKISDKITVNPVLGIGPNLNIPSLSKNLYLTTPFYYQTNKLWYMSLGLGWKF